MANTLREILVRITANSSGLDRELTTAIGKTKRFGAEMSQIGQTLALGVSLPLAGVGAAAVKAAADMDALERGLKAATKEAGPLTNQIERLRQIAKLPGLGFQEAVQGSVNLQAVGYSASQAERFLRVFGNALASVGRGRADLDGVIVQLQQMAGKSKVLAEDIKPLIQRVPQLGKAMLDLFGTIDTEQLQKMGISSKEFVSKIVTELEKLPVTTGGVKNAFENLADSSNQALARVGKVLVENFQLDQKLDALGKKIEEVGSAFSRMSPFAQNAAISIGGIATAAPLALVAIGTLIRNGAEVITFFRNWETAALGVKGALLAVAVAAVTATVLSMRDMVKAQRDAEDSAKGLNDAMARLEAHLRQRGLDISDLSKEYRNGTLTQDQYLAALRKLVLATTEVAKPTREAADSTATYKTNVVAATAAVEEFGGPIRRTTAEMLSQLEAFERLSVAQRRYAESLKAADIGDIPMPDVLNADQQRAADANLEAWKKSQQGVEGLEEALKRGAEQYPIIEESAKKTGKTQQTVWNEVDKEVDRAFRNMARGMSRSIVEWKGFGDTFKSLAKDMAAGVLEIFIQRLFDPLAKGLSGVFGGVGGSTGIIKNAVGAGGSAAGAAGSIGGGAAGAAGQIGGMAVSSVAGIVTGAVSAVSGVIGNFQMAGMNKTLDLIEKEARYSQIHLLNILENANLYWPELQSIRGYLWDHLNPALASLMSTVESMARDGSGNGTPKFVVQIDGKTILEAIAKAAPRYSGAFA